jgi:hypothetical protein
MFVVLLGFVVSLLISIAHVPSLASEGSWTKGRKDRPWDSIWVKPYVRLLTTKPFACSPCFCIYFKHKKRCISCRECSLYRYVLGTQDKSSAPKRVSVGAASIYPLGCSLQLVRFPDIWYTWSSSKLVLKKNRWQVDLLKNQKSDKVDVTIQPEELEAMDDVLAAK